MERILPVLLSLLLLTGCGGNSADGYQQITQEEAKALQDDIEAVPNVARAEFMTKEQAQEEFEADYEGNELFDGLPSDVYRDRFHVYLDDISKLTETENAVKEVTGVAKTKSAPEIAEASPSSATSPGRWP